MTSFTLEPSPVMFLWIITVVVFPPLAPPWPIYNTAAVSSCHFSAQKSPDGSAAQNKGPPASGPTCRLESMFSSSEPSRHAPPWGFHTCYSVRLEHPACFSPPSSFPGLLREPLSGEVFLLLCQIITPPSHQHCPPPALSRSAPWPSLPSGILCVCLFVYCLPFH